MNKIVLIDKDLCIGCGKCVELCPKKILYIDKGTHKCNVTDETKCDRRRGCERVCPVKAIKIAQNPGSILAAISRLIKESAK